MCCKRKSVCVQVQCGHFLQRMSLSMMVHVKKCSCDQLLCTIRFFLWISCLEYICYSNLLIVASNPAVCSQVEGTSYFYPWTPLLLIQFNTCKILWIIFLDFASLFDSKLTWTNPHCYSSVRKEIHIWNYLYKFKVLNCTELGRKVCFLVQHTQPFLHLE